MAWYSASVVVGKIACRVRFSFSIRRTQPVLQTVAALEVAGTFPGHLSVIWKALWDNKGKKEETLGNLNAVPVVKHGTGVSQPASHPPY